jgi:inhibitor of KinA
VQLAKGGTAKPYEAVCAWVEETGKTVAQTKPLPGRERVVPVCYGGEFGPDLEFVAKHNGLTEQEVIQIHSSGEYLVYMIGFAPGFPYLGGMSEKIAAPRRTSPRLKIPIGTVGIAGLQTGVYPIETPGGWQLIGRSPEQLFRPHANPPSLLQAGNLVRFQPISRDEYDAWEEGRV